MTILFFARRFYPLIGGVEKHVMEISKRLVKKGHKVVVITEDFVGDQGEKVLKETVISGIEIRRIQTGTEDKFKKIRIWKSLWQLRDVIERADVIHCHDVFFWYLPFRFLYPRKRVYTTFHGYESYPIRKGAIVIRKVSEMLSWGNICIGDFISKWYGTKPTYVSYGAVEVTPNVIARSEERTTKQSPTGLPRSFVARNDEKRESALFIGRLDDQTGILTYVRAFEILKKRYPKFEFLVVGDGVYKDKIAKKVILAGFQENPEKYFVQYHFAFVSRYLSILEAFAAKKLVVSTYDNPVKEDYLRMAPYAKWMVIEEKPEMLAKRVEELLSNPQREREMVDEAYNWVKKQTWGEMVEIYRKLWAK